MSKTKLSILGSFVFAGILTILFMYFLIWMSSVNLTLTNTLANAEQTLHKSRDGRFVIVVRTAEDNKQIDWFNEHSDMPAFWDKLGDKELELFVYSEDDKSNLGDKPEFAITASIEYGYFNNFHEMVETFHEEFILGKYRDYKIVRAKDEYGLLAEFKIVPPVLNVPYKWTAPQEYIATIHQTWWSLHFKMKDITFQGKSLKETYDSLSDNLDKVEYLDKFKKSIVLEYKDNKDKRDPIQHFFMSGSDNKTLVFSVACDKGQKVNVKIDGHLPTPDKFFMVRTKKDFEIYSPGEPQGAEITFNTLRQKFISYDFKQKKHGWDAVIRTTLELKQSQIRVSEHCKIKDFKSYPHMGGTYETTFEIEAEFNSTSIIFPGIPGPIIIIGNHVIRNWFK